MGVLESILGQPRALRQLQASLAHPSHAYLFVGPARVGKRMGALSFAQALLCADPLAGGCGHCPECALVATGNHPDLRVWDVAPGEKSFKIDAVREMIVAVSRKPYRAPRQVHVLAALDRLGLAGTNALLKTLEEPPPTTTVIGVAGEVETVLPTIVSRCQVVHFGLTPPEAIATELAGRFQVDAAVAREAAFRSQGRMGLALEFIAGAQGPLTAPELPTFEDAAAWSDAMAALQAEAQREALDGLLAWLRDIALLAAGGGWERVRHLAASERLRELAGAADTTTWLARATAVEEARNALDGHANARLVYDRLARALILPGA